MEYRITLIQNVKGQWWGMPLVRFIEATDLATAIVLAWTREEAKGVEIKDFKVDPKDRC